MAKVLRFWISVVNSLIGCFLPPVASLHRGYFFIKRLRRLRLSFVLNFFANPEFLLKTSILFLFYLIRCTWDVWLLSDIPKSEWDAPYRLLFPLIHVFSR